MSLLDDLSAPVVDIRSSCAVRRLVDELDPKEGEAVLREANANRLPLAELARRLTRNGHPIAASTIGRHRAGGCSCPR